jgi:hypothetical protein
MTVAAAVPFTPAQVTVFESRADLLTHTLKLACARLQKHGALYQSEIDSLARVTGDVIRHLAEVGVTEVGDGD